MMTSTNRPATTTALSIAVLVLGLTAAACGNSDSETNSPAETSTDSRIDDVERPESDDGDVAGFGGPGRWSAEQLCALSTPDAVSAQFGVSKVEERPGIDDPEWTSCSWRDADADPLGAPPVRASQYGGFASDALGLDVDIDIDGADMAGYSDNTGGAALVLVAVGDQLLEIGFPLDTPGAQEFGTAIATTWVAAQAR